jgi:hypothetical protein
MGLRLQFVRGPTVAGWMSISARVAGVAIVIPIAFKVLSPADAVLWMFFTTALSLHGLLDFGHNSTLIRMIASARARGDASLIGVQQGRLYAPGLAVLIEIMPRIYLRLTLVMCGLVLLLLTPLIDAPITASSNPTAHWLLWLFAAMCLAAQVYGGRYIAVLQGFEKVATQRWVEALHAVASSLAAGLLLLSLGRLFEPILAICISGLCAVLANRRYAQSLLARRHIDRHMKEARDVARRIVWAAAWRSGVGVLCSMGLVHLLTMSVGSILAPAEGASFMFAMRISQVISSFSQTPFYAHLPTLTRKYKEKRLNEVRREAKKRVSAACLIAIVGVVLVGLLGPHAMARLGLKIPFLDQKTWLLLGSAILVERIGAMHMQLYTLGGKVIWHWVNGVTGAVILGATLLLLPGYGAVAIPAAMLLAYAAIYCSLTIPRSYRLLELKFSTFDRDACLPSIILLALYAGYVVLRG